MIKRNLWPIVLALVFLVGCSPVDMRQLEEQNGVVRLKGDKVPYTGDAISYFPGSTPADGGTPRIYQSGSYKFGLKEGHWITYKWTGERTEAEYHLGHLEGTLVQYDSYDRKVMEQEYRGDKLNGFSSFFDVNSGEPTKRLYYKDGVAASWPRSEGAGTGSNAWWRKVSDEFNDIGKR